MTELGNSKGRGLFVAIAAGWMAMAAIGLMGSAGSGLAHVVGLAELAESYDEEEAAEEATPAWDEVYGGELAALGLLLHGLTLACSIALYRRRAWARVPLQALIVFQIAALFLFAAVHWQSMTARVEDWTRNAPDSWGAHPAFLASMLGIMAVTTLGICVLSIASLFGLRHPALKNQLE
jgi:hypothetical protein